MYRGNLVYFGYPTTGRTARDGLNLCFGKPVTDDQILEVAMNQYRAVGGGDYTMFGADKIVKEVTVDMTELIADFLKNILN